ncbi:uncharacterized protein [Halyomorpha halys]|uniref:uncharacterized protein n=1 Tax=Halyomorpha halys TaxID=286706 RepID=UPI0006D50568|nr:uncharacterized protein LOC106681901 [Halyomorpha halys]
MMTWNNENFNRIENIEHQLVPFRGGLVPQKSSFFTSLEDEVKKIIRACQFTNVNGRANYCKRGKMNQNYRNNVLKRKPKTKFSRDKCDDSSMKRGPGTVKKDRPSKNAGHSPNCLANRNWQKLSIHPFINFMRLFRKKAPSDCPLHVMRVKAREIWRKMDKERKYPYLEQALKAKQKGYIT